MACPICHDTRWKSVIEDGVERRGPLRLLAGGGG